MTTIHALKPHTYYTLCGRDSWPDTGPRLLVGEEPTCKKCRPGPPALNRRDRAPAQQTRRRVPIVSEGLRFPGEAYGT